MLEPVFRGSDGREAADPLALVDSDSPPVVDVAALALLFAPPALYGEFVPRPPWRGVERIRTVPVPAPEPVPLGEAFTSAVATLAADVEVVGVKVSGGLDSLAVLVHAVRRAEGRTVVAFTADLVDDAGVSAATVVRRLVADLELGCELVVLDPDRHRAVPRWSPCGPRLDALPAVNAAVSEFAAARGVGVLLSGDGADELLGVPRFATAAITRRWGVRAGLRYAADVGHTGPGLAGEVAALVAALLPPRTRARAYWAANWPEWCDPVAPRVVAEPYREATTRWARAWVAEQVAAHAAAGRSWAQADAHDALWPHDVIPPAGEVPEASPFLHPAFLPAALALALADRYDPALPTPYQRCKAQIVKLFPEPMRRVLPRRKQYYSTTLVAAAAQPIAAPRAVAAGLLDPDALAVETDVAVRLTAAAVEDWLAGAEAAGAQLPRPARDHSGLL